MRQYAILYKRDGMKDFKRLQPFVDTNLYSRVEVQGAIDHMRRNVHIEGIAVRVVDEQFNVMTFDQEAIAPNAFRFEDTLEQNEPVDRKKFRETLAG